MTYDEKTARATVKEWDLPARKILTWRRNNAIPDEYALRLNIKNNNRELWLARFLALVGSGWIKSEAVCRHYGWHLSKFSDIMSYLRNPDELDYRTMAGEDVQALMSDFLIPLYDTLGKVLHQYYSTDASEMYSDDLQTLTRQMLAHPFINSARVQSELIPENVNRVRFWIAGKRRNFKRPIDRFVLTQVFTEIQSLYKLLNIKIQ